LRRRADAERSIAAIVEAALELFREGSDSSMSDIARAAGVGRVTLYAHFPSREAVLEAVLDRTLREVAATLHGELTADGPADEALVQLLRAGWQILDRHRSVAAAAARSLAPERLRALHDPAMGQVERIIARGQAEGAFRRDVSSTWLVAVCYSVIHTAAQEVEAGRLAAAEAPAALEATLLSALRGPSAMAKPGRGTARDPASPEPRC
jgi:TetR/AcrR family transcriptional repressor of mexCD-oprJ operon